MSRYSIYKSFEINGHEYSNRYALLDHIDEVKDVIKSIEDRIKMWAIADPNSVIPDRDEDDTPVTDKVWFVQRAIKDELDSLQDFYKELAVLELMDYNWDEQEYPEDEHKKWEEENKKKKEQSDQKPKDETKPQTAESSSENNNNNDNYSPFDQVHDLKPGPFIG